MCKRRFSKAPLFTKLTGVAHLNSPLALPQHHNEKLGTFTPGFQEMRVALDQSPINSHVILNQYYHVTCVPMQDMQDAPVYAQAGKEYLSFQRPLLRENAA